MLQIVGVQVRGDFERTKKLANSVPKLREFVKNKNSNASFFKQSSTTQRCINTEYNFLLNQSSVQAVLKLMTNL